MNIKPNALMVSVDFSDFLDITLEYNRHHFERVVVVTTSQDIDTRIVAAKNDADVFTTDSFYETGAIFNKHKPLEEGLDFLGREGWLCLIDTDILWPKTLPAFDLEVGSIYGPTRRVMEHIEFPIPDDWEAFPLYLPKSPLIAGYSQIFHASDSVLGGSPWHETNWKHAGGADTFFQQKWSKQNRRRLPFSVLHLGEVGMNWCGRLQPTLDSSPLSFEKERREALSFFTKKPGYPRRGPHEKY